MFYNVRVCVRNSYILVFLDAASSSWFLRMMQGAKLARNTSRDCNPAVALESASLCKRGLEVENTAGVFDECNNLTHSGHCAHACGFASIDITICDMSSTVSVAVLAWASLASASSSSRRRSSMFKSPSSTMLMVFRSVQHAPACRR